MAKQKTITPYQRLLDEIHDLVFKWRHRHTVSLFTIPVSDLKTKSFTMLDVYHKVQAAQDLGYEVVLEVGSDRLYAFYKRKVEVPFHLNPDNA